MRTHIQPSSLLNGRSWLAAAQGSSGKLAALHEHSAASATEAQGSKSTNHEFPNYLEVQGTHDWVIAPFISQLRGLTSGL